jgi:hypothetical protein
MIYTIIENHASVVEADSPEEARKIWDEYRESADYMRDQWDLKSVRYVEYFVETFDNDGERVGLA